MTVKKTLITALVLILLLILTTNLASALGDDATIHITRLTNTFVGIKIDFANDISGDFAGVINGKYFDCVTVGPRTLYCLGKLAYWVDGATLHIYENPGGNVVLTRVITVPPKIGDETHAPPIQQCVECEQ